MNNSPRLSLESYRLEILSNALTALTEEIQITLLRSAYSQVVKEAQDASCAIFTARPHRRPAGGYSRPSRLDEIHAGGSPEGHSNATLVPVTFSSATILIAAAAICRTSRYSGRSFSNGVWSDSPAASCIIPMSAAWCRAAIRNARLNSIRKGW